ncbi:MAG: hypothetical protein IAE82_06200 [Opitutaceae bacterium]|nr:hypothetical protein [Opitutaceae bacterium]
MKNIFPWLAFLGLAVAALAAAPAPKLILPAVPELGTTIRALPDMLSWQLVSRTQVLPCFEVTVGQTDYTVAVEGKKHRVAWVSSQATMFVTPENFSIRTKVADVLAKYPDKLVQEEGFGGFVPLPSGWNALVVREGKLDPNARVILYFRRAVTPEPTE